MQLVLSSEPDGTLKLDLSLHVVLSVGRLGECIFIRVDRVVGF